MRRVPWPFILAFLVALFAILCLLQSLRNKVVEETAAYSAEIWSTQLKSIREIYTKTVVNRVVKQGVAASHDYESNELSIPLPFTFTTLLARSLQDTHPEVQTSLISPYPFPWNKQAHKLESPDWKQTWLALKKEPHYSRVVIGYDEPGHSLTLKHSSADIMHQQCISCHNSHPSSPKKDWKEGQLAGILEVKIPLDSVLAKTGDYVMFFGGGIVILFLCLFAVAYYFHYQLISQSQQLILLNQDLIMASDFERTKLSHQIHDGIAQLLTGASFLLAAEKGRKDPLIDEVQQVITKALSQARSLVKCMYPLDGVKNRLETSLAEFANTTMEQFSVRLDLSRVNHEFVHELSPKESAELYFICTEAVTNAIKHGHAKNIWIRICDGSMSIYDDGSGFKDGKNLSGIGTRIMKYRASVIGWSFGMGQRTPSNGTIVFCQRYKAARCL